MNTIYKSKSQVRSETESAVEMFLRSGGVIQVVKSRKAPKQLMTCKNSRGFTSGSSGFANGFPKRSTGA